MKKALLVALISAFLVAGCAIGFRGGHRGRSTVILPAPPGTEEVRTRGHDEHDQDKRDQDKREQDKREQDKRDQDRHDQDNRDHDNQQHN